MTVPAASARDPSATPDAAAPAGSTGPLGSPRTREAVSGTRGRWVAVGVATTALLGPLPVAVLAGVCVARFLPASENTRFTVGITLVIPLWLAGTCRAFLVSRTSRALLACVVLSAALGALAYGVPS